MRVQVGVLCVACLAACGSTRALETSEPSTAPTPAATSSGGYDLHEWGLLSVRDGSVELAAGPGRPQLRPDMGITVDKPIVYVHNSQPTRFSLRVAVGAGYELAERWPGEGAPIVWEVAAEPGACTSQTPYPSSCRSADGYCEVRELAGYEAADSSCLQVGDAHASLLFYRLRAADPAVTGRLPVQVEAGRVRASAARTAWRVQIDEGGVAHAQRVELSAAGTDLGATPTGSVEEAAAWAHGELARLGMTPAERGAFERAWWSSLFHLDAGAADEDGVSDMPVLPTADVLPVADETSLDRLSTDGRFGADASSDVLLYFLSDAEIDAIARLEATPAPRQVHRAFLVRQALR
ncbi:MAG: hypothetical protein GXP55_14690 [Deltaproteobacteria bacterium]|nr:hypothetical protein [Deltaproteobacteria bacterium]